MECSTPDWIGDRLEELHRSDLWRPRREMTVLPKGRGDIDGHEQLNFASNDYLGLAHDSRIREAVVKCLQSSALGATASPLVAGRSPWHVELERTIAAFEGTESSLLFPSGFAANLGTIAALAGPDDTIFCDRLNHASLIDGCRLAGSHLVVYRHDRLDKLKRRMQQKQLGRRFLVTDTLFSMDGDCAPLSDLVTLCEQNSVFLIVDEAHATGVLGKQGRGVSELQGVEDRIPLRIGTLSKSIGLQGGFAVGSSDLMDYLWHMARTQMYSTGLPPSICAGVCQAFKILLNEEWRRDHLHLLSLQLRNRCNQMGLAIPETVCGPIVPIPVGSSEEALSVSHLLKEAGMLVPAIRPPTVPARTARLRISLSAAHSSADVDRLADGLQEILPPRKILSSR